MSLESATVISSLADESPEQRRDTGMPIAAMQRYAEHVQADTAETIPDCLAILEAHERSVAANIALLQKQRRHLKEKIAHYRELV